MTPRARGDGFENDPSRSVGTTTLAAHTCVLAYVFGLRVPGDRHHLTPADRNGALVCSALSGALGLLCGISVGLSIRKK